MGQALYRKYRSKTLAEMVGQQHVTTALASAIQSGRISHAYLFTGPRGVGKTSAARILAHEINNLPYDETSSHLDIIEIDAASNRRIDDIRDLRDKVHIAPASAKYKVYIIDEVHMLTGESFNALLKTLEEPPEHVVFILATTEVHKLPATIISRTQRYSFRLVDAPEVVAHLRFIANEENIEADDAALELIAEHGEGSFRDSISLLDQLANVNQGKIDAKTVERSLGLAPKEAVSSLIEAVAKNEYQAVAKQLNELEQQGTTPTALLPQLIRQLQQAAAKEPRLYGLLDQLLDVPRAYNPRLKLLTTLVRFALPAEQPVAKGSNPSAPATTEPPKHRPAPVAAKPILNVEKPQPPKRKALEPEQQQAEGHLDDITPDQWSQVLAEVKKISPPLHGVVRQAQPVFDAEAQLLTLKFKYQLHRKKIDDSKPKKALAHIMLQLLGGAPVIMTTIDTNAEAPKIIAPASLAPPSEADQTTSAVIAMMGGGEVVDA
jgi:DNA polymerase III subunit gamma/tau